jgi:hypothetical protein
MHTILRQNVKLLMMEDQYVGVANALASHVSTLLDLGTTITLGVVVEWALTVIHEKHREIMVMGVQLVEGR